MIAKVLIFACVCAAATVVSSENTKDVPTWVQSKREVETEVHYLAKRGDPFTDFFGAIFSFLGLVLKTIFEWIFGSNFGRSMQYAFQFQDIKTPFDPASPSSSPPASSTPAPATTTKSPLATGI